SERSGWGTFSRGGGASRADGETVRTATAQSVQPSRIMCRVGVIDRLSPELEQSAVEPIPQEVCEQLRLSLLTLIQRDPHADAQQNVLKFAERDLHLRHDVPFGGGAVRARGEHFEHRGPGAPEPLIASEGVSERRAYKRFGVSEGLVRWDFDAAMHLKEGVGADDLSPHGKRPGGPDTAAQSLILFAGRCDDGAAGGEDAPAIQVGVERPPHGELDVADPAAPCAPGFLLCSGDWERPLELAARADAVLVDELIADCLCTRRGDARRPDG